MKDFIPHEPALALKELGFDEPCLGYYLCRNSAFGIDDLLITTEWIDLLPYDSSSCKAPTYSQAFRWFREKYDLISYIHPLALLQDTKKWCYEITNFESSWDEDIDLHSPEEAELECLKKLIEIVKTK
jgi:hypothetical protein